MNQNPEEKLARPRLSVLELAQALGNVSEACRRRGISRTTFYEYKQRFEKDGLEGLQDLPPIPKSHPMTTPDEHVGAFACGESGSPGVGLQPALRYAQAGGDFHLGADDPEHFEQARSPYPLRSVAAPRAPRS